MACLARTTPWVRSSAQHKPGLGVYTYNPRNEDMEAGGSEVQGDPQVHREFEARVKCMSPCLKRTTNNIWALAVTISALWRPRQEDQELRGQLCTYCEHFPNISLNSLAYQGYGVHLIAGQSPKTCPGSCKRIKSYLTAALARVSTKADSDLDRHCRFTI